MSRRLPEELVVEGNRLIAVNVKLTKEKELIHILKRSLLGVSFAGYASFRGMPAGEAIQKLLQTGLPDSYPLKDYNSVNSQSPDFRIKVGETWIDDRSYDPQINLKRKESLKKWWMGLLYTQQYSLQPKMMLFWLNYFPIQIQRINMATTAYNYFSTIKDHALGNFRDLFLYLATGDALMEYHKKIRSSSEALIKFHARITLNNYLFGDDCTRYISQDKIRKFYKLLNEYHRLQNGLHHESRLAQEALDNLSDFTGRLLQHEVIARVLSERIFRWFVHPQINSKLVGKLTSAALEHQYDLKKIMETLLLHEEFYSIDYYGCQVKNPVEFIYGVCKELDIDIYPDHQELNNYPMWEWLFARSAEQGMSTGDSPNEKGWQNSWISSEILKKRESLTNQVIDPGHSFETRFMKNNPLNVLSAIPFVEELDAFIDHLITFYLHTHFSQEKTIAFREYLRLHYNITEESWKYLILHLKGHPADKNAKNEIISVIKNSLRYFLESTEYQYC
jgi:hypothetical protein